jgi:hypothetical protein
METRSIVRALARLAALSVVTSLLPVPARSDIPAFPCSDGAQAYLLAAPNGGPITKDALAPDGSAILGRDGFTKRGYWLRSEGFGVFHELTALVASYRPNAISNGARYVVGYRVVGSGLEGVRVELATGAEDSLGPLVPDGISGDGSRVVGVVTVANATCTERLFNDQNYAAAYWDAGPGGGLSLLPTPATPDAGLAEIVGGLLYPVVYGSVSGFYPQDSITQPVVVSPTGIAIAATINTGVWVDLHDNADGSVCVGGSIGGFCSDAVACSAGERCEPWSSISCADSVGGGTNAVRWIASSPEIQLRPPIDIAANTRPSNGDRGDIGSVGTGQAQALSISDDGNVVIGWSLDEKPQAGGGTTLAQFVTRWVGGGAPEVLWEGRQAAGSFDGRQAVGYGQFPPGHPLQGITAYMYWDADGGARELHATLRDDYGVDGFSFTIPDIRAALHAEGGIIVAPGQIGGSSGEVAVVLPCPDRDRDNLCDSWERTGGIDLNGDGILRPTDDLLLPDADPNHRDVYVEVDVVQGSVLPNAALKAVAEAFADVPNSKIGNPDGEPGINLHLLRDESGLTLISGNTYQPRGPNPGCRLPVDVDVLRPTWFGTAQERTNVDVIAAKEKIYRYLIFGGQLSAGWSGIAEISGNAALVTMDNFTARPGFGDDWLAGTIMHELGHTFGLHHGGTDENQYKPNYHSVMNYTWQVPHTAGPGSRADEYALSNSWLLDYSRRAFDLLDESRLLEQGGIGGAFGRVTVAGPRLPCARNPAGCLRVVSEVGTVDWNRDGTIEPLLPLASPVDINDLEFPSMPSPGDVLTSWDDWTLLADRLCSDYANQNWDPLFDGSTASCGAGIEPVEERTADEVEAFLSEERFLDCNLNGEDDQAEIDAGAAFDANGNGLLDGCEPLRGDVDGDDDLDLDDRELLAASFGLREGEAGYEMLADLDADRQITFVDYQIWVGLHEAWLSSTSPTCGLLGLELLPLAALALLRRRRAGPRRAGRRGGR